MRFGSLKRHWERLGRRDPYWAVLTDPGKRGGGWDLDEFFRSGTAEIGAVLRRADALGLVRQRRRALDFGCGAGRLTQAMATQFAHADGVDISESMLRVARRHDRHPDRCTYRVNRSPDLALFADATFDFIYSTLVLQHMDPRYSKRYIREFVRVLAPGGLLVFQLPSQQSPEQPPPDARRTPSRGPLPGGAFQARLSTEQPQATAGPGEPLMFDVTVVNTSSHVWPSLPDARGRCQVNVANRWLHEDGELLQRDDGRCPLPFDVAPGGRARVVLMVTAPPADGVYQLELDLVQEDVGWFHERGSTALRLPCVVGAGLAGPRRPPKVAAPASPTFSQRHPRAFAMMRATGVRDAYWSWRRGVDRVKSVRDDVIVDVRQRLYLPRIINWWRRGPFAALMEMHCVPRAEVLAVLGDAGGHVLDVEEEWMREFKSCRYWVTKRSVEGSGIRDQGSGIKGSGIPRHRSGSSAARWPF